MKKIIMVTTDDPERKKISLVVTGPVESVVDITPATVYMDGKPGDTLEAVVNITPSEKYKFSILGLEQKINAGIKASLVDLREDKTSWQVKIQSTSDKADDFYDLLTLKTDSKYKPKLFIRVYAIFLEKQAPKS